LNFVKECCLKKILTKIPRICQGMLSKENSSSKLFVECCLEMSPEDVTAERALAESLERLNVPDDEDGWGDEHSPKKNKDAWDAGMDDDWGREGEESDDEDVYDGPLSASEQEQLDSMVTEEEVCHHTS
jgi:hypothetical protein